MDTIEGIATAKQANLRYALDTQPGITRKRAGKGFLYFDTSGNIIKDTHIKHRIKELVIPPAWEQVWICEDENGHLQATGTDEKGRKQYIYHPEWTKLCQENKFNKLLYFAEVLPSLRRKVSSDMHMRGLTQERILATIIWLLEHTYIRIGNQEYAKENNSFGLTTLRNKHIEIEKDHVTIEFKGKSGVFHSVEVTNPRVVRTIRRLEELPGYELFQYIDDNGERHTVDSSDVNAYLQRITGDGVSAKDFRTWSGTVLGAVSLCKIGPFTSKTEAKKNITQSVKIVSKHLGNTPGVCRNYYIHPTIFATYEKEVLIPHFQTYTKKEKNERLTQEEYATYTLLQTYSQ